MIGPDAATNLDLLSAMVEQLGPFLDEGEVTRKVLADAGGQRRHTTMSVGILLNLTAWLRRSEPSMSAAQQAELSRLLDRYESLRASRSVEYAAILRRELTGHLDSWSWYIDELERGDNASAEDYAGEVWIRTRASQLVDEARRLSIDVDAERQRLAGLDTRLRPMLVAGPYAGAPGEQDAHPRDEHWWLYMRPRPSLGR